jgi:hypothetical protein
MHIGPERGRFWTTGRPASASAKTYVVANADLPAARA